MIIASWLLTLDPKRVQAVYTTLAAAPGQQIRSKSGSRWLVLMTETSQKLDVIRQQLLDTPGVQTADPIASFDEDAPGLEVVRWKTDALATGADVAGPEPPRAGSAAAGAPDGVVP
jgi:hypothetical protein